MAAQFEVKYQSFQEAGSTLDVKSGAVNFGDVEMRSAGVESEADWVTVDMEGRIANVVLGQRPQGRVYSVKVVPPFRQRNVATLFPREVIRVDTGPKETNTKKAPKKKAAIGSDVTLTEDEDTDKLIQYYFEGDDLNEIPGLTYLEIPKFPAALLGDEATETGDGSHQLEDPNQEISISGTIRRSSIAETITGVFDAQEVKEDDIAPEVKVSGIISMDETKHQILLVKKGQLIQVSKKGDEEHGTEGWWYGTVVYDRDEIERIHQLKVEKASLLLCLVPDLTRSVPMFP